jgi:hypothetical protein
MLTRLRGYHTLQGDNSLKSVERFDLASSCKDSRETLVTLLSNQNLDRSIKNNLGETAETICRRTSALCKLFDEILPTVICFSINISIVL